MAFHPAYCDDNCKGCSENKGGWCIWKDVAATGYAANSIAAGVTMSASVKTEFVQTASGSLGKVRIRPAAEE